MHSLQSAITRSALRSRLADTSRHAFLQIRMVPRVQRCYATEEQTPVEPPDYLDERELKVFETIKRELHPLKLDVSGDPSLEVGNWFTDVRYESGTGHIGWMWLYVRN